MLRFFGGGGEKVTDIEGFPTDSYITFVLGAILIQAAVGATTMAGNALGSDIETGFLSRLSLTPVPGSALIAAQLAGVALIGVVQARDHTCWWGWPPAQASRRASRGALALHRGDPAGDPRLRLDRPADRGANGRGGAGPVALLARLALLFMSSMIMPRNLIQEELVRDDRHLQPDVVPDRGPAQPADHRVGRRGARPRLRARRRRPGRGLDRRRPPACGAGSCRRDRGAFALHRARSGAAGPPSSCSRSPLQAAAADPGSAVLLRRVQRRALDGRGHQGLPYYDYTAFQFVFLLFMASMFSGIFTAFDIARDFEGGMGNRMMLAAPQRMAIIGGYLIVSLGRVAARHRRGLGGRAGRRHGGARRRRRHRGRRRWRSC